MRLNISVSDDLAAAIRELDLPISRICQAALTNAVARSEPTALAAAIEADADQLVGVLKAHAG